MMIGLGYLLAIAIGISLGLLGGGGSVLALPVLVYVMGVDPKPAIAMTLVIVGTVSLLGAIPHGRRGNLNLRIVALFGMATMIGAYGGARLASLPVVTSGLQMLIFALAMLVAAGLMIYRSMRPPLQEVIQTQPHHAQDMTRWLGLLLQGLAVGLLTGLVGVGGGFAIVPALVLMGKVPMRQAIGSSLLIISCNSVAGLLGYLGQVTLDWPLTVSFTFLAAIGTLLGAYLAQFVTPAKLQTAFGYFLLAVAAFVLVQNRDAFREVQPRSNVTRPTVMIRS